MQLKLIGGIHQVDVQICFVDNAQCGTVLGPSTWVTISAANDGWHKISEEVPDKTAFVFSVKSHDGAAFNITGWEAF
jgi:hypothetical protein